MIVRGTTPTIRFNFVAIDTANIAVAYLTIKQNGSVLIEKDLEDGDVQEGYIEWALTQEDTLAMSPCSDVYIQCRYKLNDGSAYATRIYMERPYNVEKDGVI